MVEQTSKINNKENEKSEKKPRKKTSILKAIIYDINDWRINSRKLGTVDLPFFFIVIILLVMGIIMMFSASYAKAISEGSDGAYYAKQQILFAAAGIVSMFIISKIDYHIFQNKFITVSLFLLCIVMLLLVIFTPLGIERNNARRWLGYGGFQFQPSEVMKLAIVLLFAVMLTNNYKRMKEFKRGVLPFIIILGVVAALLMKQPHLSCTLIICAIGIAMIYIGGARLWHLVFMGLGGIVALAAVVLYKIQIQGFSYFEKRFQSWLNPFEDITGNTWQTAQSLIAIGSGGIFGMGLGNSRQKFLYLPESKNDFVFSIVCEELGFVGAVTVIALFAFFVFRGFYIASKSPDKFGMLVCIGLTTQVGVQAFLNIAVVSNLIPNTGISLPFFSYGGTSLMMLLAQMGIILNISRHAMADENDE